MLGVECQEALFPRRDACSLDQEVILRQRRALHFLTHPRGEHTPPRPLAAPVLFRLIFRRRLLTFAGSRNTHHSTNGSRGLVRGVDLKPGNLAFQDFPLLLDFRGKQVFEVVDVGPELADFHLGKALRQTFK